MALTLVENWSPRQENRGRKEQTQFCRVTNPAGFEGGCSPVGNPPPPIGMPGTEFRATRPMPGPASPLGTDEIWTSLAQVLDRHAGGMVPSVELGGQN